MDLSIHRINAVPYASSGLNDKAKAFQSHEVSLCRSAIPCKQNGSHRPKSDYFA